MPNLVPTNNAIGREWACYSIEVGDILLPLDTYIWMHVHPIFTHLRRVENNRSGVFLVLSYLSYQVIEIFCLWGGNITLGSVPAPQRAD